MKHIEDADPGESALELSASETQSWREFGEAGRSMLIKPEEMVAILFTTDPGQVEAWISQQIENGHIAPEQLPQLMARYALTEPGLTLEEFAERMGSANEIEKEPSRPTRERSS